MVASMDAPAKGGFSFDLCPRNGMLEKKGLKVPGFRKTGTTIVGLVFAVCTHTHTHWPVYFFFMFSSAIRQIS